MKDFETPIEVLYIRHHDNRYEIARLLIDYGADVNLADEVRTPIFRVVQGHSKYPDEEVILNLQLLIENDSILYSRNDSSVLMIASLQDREKVVEYLIETELFDLNHVNKDNQTALLFASYRNRTEIVELLLKHGADKTIRNADEKTALDYAKENNNQEMIELLSD